jgi:hypothetical protein
LKKPRGGISAKAASVGVEWMARTRPLNGKRRVELQDMDHHILNEKNEANGAFFAGDGTDGSHGVAHVGAGVAHLEDDLTTKR